MGVSYWLPSITAAMVLWYECAENPMVFCYRIGWVVYRNWRSRELAAIPNFERHDTACSNRSFTFSTRSIVPTGSEN